MARVLIVCGGTGGHLTPGIAVAEELIERGHACTLVVSRKKVDRRLIRKYASLECIEAPGAPFSFKPGVFITFLWAQIRSFVFAFHLLRKTQPQLILGFGGFLCAGIAIPGFFFGKPFVLHEANRVVGRSNRLLSRLAKRVFLPVGLELKSLPPGRVLHAGLPLRREFQPMSQVEARRRLAIETDHKLLVVFGGSQGASSLNRWALQHRQAWAEKGVSLYCLTGPAKDQPGEVVSRTQSAGQVRSWFVPFSDAMPAVLSAADAVISRAGAGSIAEIIRCGVPAILVPYPFARDDHQTANARFVAEKGAALVVEEAHLPDLFDQACRLLFDDERGAALRENMQSLDQPTEVKLLADTLEALLPSAPANPNSSTIRHREA